VPLAAKRRTTPADRAAAATTGHLVSPSGALKPLEALSLSRRHGPGHKMAVHKQKKWLVASLERAAATDDCNDEYGRKRS